MSQIVEDSSFYGPGSFVDQSAPAVPEDAYRVFELLARATPGFTQDKEQWKSVQFEGTSEPIAPGPLKSPVVAAALHAMCGIVANELLAIRKGSVVANDVVVNTDHAALWLGSVGMTERNGTSIPELLKTGKLAGIFDKDLEKDTFATPLRLRTTAVYPTKDSSTWYQLHGSLDADAVLQSIGIGQNTECVSRDEAYDMISRHVAKFSAEELEKMNVEAGLCGSTCYTPDAWRQTQMSRALSKHPLMNVKAVSEITPTPAVPLNRLISDQRPLAGIKVVELVRIIAGPVIGTTLAALGADVIRVNCSRLPDFNSLQPTLNAGVRTVDIDLKQEKEAAKLKELLQGADVFVQGYRPGTIAKNGLGLSDLVKMAEERGKGIIYVEENCYGPDGPMSDRPGWQQIADAASGCSFVTGRSLGFTDGTCVLPALPVPDMLTGLIGAIGTMMALRDRARNGGSHHVFASLMAAAALLLEPEVGMYSPEVVQKCDDRFAWGKSDPGLFVLELLDLVLQGWKAKFPGYFAADSPMMTILEGDWGKFRLLKPVLKLAEESVSPRWIAAPQANCWLSSDSIAWL